MSVMGRAGRASLAARPDADLVRAVRSGDAAAFEEIVRRHERVVFSIARTVGLGHDDAADVTQIVFAAFASSVDTLDQPEHVRAWLCTVARRHSWRVLGRARRETPGDVPDHIAEVDAIARADAVADLLDALDQLRPRCRDLVVALYLSRPPMSYDEVAERLGMSIGSIGPTRARCLDDLRRRLDPDC